MFTGDRNDEWITEGGGSIYFYYPASLEHINQNIFRIWIKRLQLGKDTLTAKNTYESKMLYEIDSKNSKVRTLSLSYYNKEGQLLSKIETEDPKWSFIVPESISYDIWKYFKYK